MSQPDRDTGGPLEPSSSQIPPPGSLQPVQRPQLLSTAGGQKSHYRQVQPLPDSTPVPILPERRETGSERKIPNYRSMDAAAMHLPSPNFEELSRIGGRARRSLTYESVGPIRQQLYAAGVTARPCQERACRGPPLGDELTFPCCDEHCGRAFDLCLECRIASEQLRQPIEDQMLERNRLYLCYDCTMRRKSLPVLQPWEHSMRSPYDTRDRRSKTCGCVERLRNFWLCAGHRQALFNSTMFHGVEKVAVFQGQVGRNMCPSCRGAKANTRGAVLMWNCAICEDLVMDDGNEEM